MATTKELEERLAALEDLPERVSRLEGLTGHGTPVEAEVDQEASDAAILGRFANTRDEAVAQEAARKRQAERDGVNPEDITVPGAASDPVATPES